MGFFTEYPYTDVERANNDWLLRRIKDLSAEVENFIINEKIKNAYPFIWDITKQYENHVIVATDDGTVYLSLKPVPSGIDINNTDYWVKIANGYDLNDVKYLKNRHYNLVAFGDSFGDYSRDNTPAKSWVKHLGDYMHCDNVYNYCKSGAGFLVNPIDPHPTMHDEFVLAKNDGDGGIYDPKTITHVVIFEGVNDQVQRGNESALLNAIVSFAAEVKNYYPNATIYYAQNWGKNAMPSWCWDIFDIMAKEIAIHGIVYLPDMECTLLSCPANYVESDLTHPTIDGAKLLASRLYSKINGGDYDPLGDSGYFHPTFTDAGGVPYEETRIRFRWSRNGHMMHCHMNFDGDVDVSNPITINSPSLVALVSNDNAPRVGLFGASTYPNFKYHFETFQDASGHIFDSGDIVNIEFNGIGVNINTNASASHTVTFNYPIYIDFDVDIHGLFGNW